MLAVAGTRRQKPTHPAQPSPSVLRAAPGAGGSAEDLLPRPPAHLRLPALPEERPPKVRSGTPGARLSRHHPRHLQSHAPRHGWRGRRRYWRGFGLKRTGSVLPCVPDFGKRVVTASLPPQVQDLGTTLLYAAVDPLYSWHFRIVRLAGLEQQRKISEKQDCLTMEVRL